MQTETIVFGGGCFWCTEAVFTMLKGVQSVEPGYSGSDKVEVVKVEYDPDKIAFEELLQVFFGSHDPTTPHQQGNDVGPQYHSAIFYTTERQRQKAQHYIDVLNGASRPDQSVGVKRIVTEVSPLENPPAGGFHPAEDYHKNYFKNNPAAGYCQLVIAPKVEKVEQKFKNLLK